MEIKSFHQWLYDYNLFKYQCHFKRATINASLDIIESKLKSKIAEARVDIIQERSKLIKHKYEESEKKHLKAEVTKTNELALKAIQKEVLLEEKIKKEEEQKVAEEQEEIQAEIDEEKKKEECLLKAIKEREMEDQYNIKKINAARDIENIKKNVVKTIQVRRNYLRAFILKMKKRAQRAKNKKYQELQTVRYQMATDMNNLYQSGDIEKCKLAISSPLNRETYCGIHFAEDLVRFTTCKTEEEDFCYLCCESEFGDLHVDKRHECYEKLCAKKREEEKNNNFVLGDRGNGRWIWDGETKKITI